MAPRQEPRQESSSVRQKDSGYRANSIASSHHTFRAAEVNLARPACFLRQTGRLARDGLRFRPLLHGSGRRNNAAVEPERKETVAAGGAAIRRHAKKAKDPGQHAHAVLAGNALQIHVAAQAAMHKPDIADGSRPGVKAGIAGLAAPGTQPRDSHRVVFDTASAGAAGAVAMTDRTYQNSLHPWEVCEKNTEELLPWQVRSAHRCRCMYNGPEALAPRWNRDGQEPLVAARHRQPLAARR